MAVGRQDYQAGVVPIKSGYSLRQTPYFDSYGISVVTGNTAWLCTYTVPVGYQLNITGIRISTNFPGIQLGWLEIDGNVQLVTYYDSLIIDNFPEGSQLVVSAGEKVRIYVKNNFPPTNWYWGEILGFLEQIET